MYIHELNPIAFSLFDFKIYWYSLSYLFGFIFSYFYVKLILNKNFVNISFKIFEDFLGWAVIGVVIGGRIGYVIFYNLNFYLENPVEILKIWETQFLLHKLFRSNRGYIQVKNFLRAARDKKKRV